MVPYAFVATCAPRMITYVTSYVGGAYRSTGRSACEEPSAGINHAAANNQQRMPTL